MNPIVKLVLPLAAALLSATAPAQTPAAAAPAPVPAAAPAPPVGRKLVEVYRVAPGQHEAFLRVIARLDEANRRAGVPARQLFVHSDGASWDFLLIQDAEFPEGKGELVGKAYKEMGIPTGPRFFTEFRKLLIEHTDTFAKGPTTAGAFLADLDATPRLTFVDAPQPAAPPAPPASTARKAPESNP